MIFYISYLEKGGIKVKNVVLLAEERTGKIKPNVLRSSGLTPGVMYHEGNSISIQIVTKDLLNIIKKEGQSAIFDLSYKDKKNQVFIKELQKDPITQELLHVDLQPIAMDETMKVSVPINIEGQHQVESKGGIIQRQIREIEIEAFPRDIPKSIDVDISNLNIGENLLVGDLQVANEITVLSNPEEVILIISEPSMEAEEVDTEEVEVVEEVQQEEE